MYHASMKKSLSPLKTFVAIACLCAPALNVLAQSLPQGQPRRLLTYEGDLKEARIKSHAALPPWLAKCDTPFYEVFSIRTLGSTPATIALFIGGSAREEVLTYTLIPDAVKSCASLSRLDGYTIRRPMPMPKGGYSEIVPVLNAKGEVVYLLHEEKLPTSNQGGASFTRTLLALSGKTLKQTARVTKSGANAEQLVDAAIPFTTLLK